MKKLISIIFALTVFANIAVTAFADFGPKASVTVNIKGVESAGEYYATLLSKYRSTGPADAYIESEHSADEVRKMYEDKSEIWRAFQSYSDADGYYYLQEHWKLTKDSVCCWGYYPPDEFKILLYFPETERYLVSEPLERYAFTAYFTASIADGSLQVSEGKGTAAFFAELVAFLIRAAVTAGLELLVALGFGYKNKKAVRIIIITNIVTQIILNAVLYIANFRDGFLMAAIAYILLEFAVFAAEAIVYAPLLPGTTEKKTGALRAVLYALAANFASFIIGGILAIFLFGISDLFMYI